jgi:hypothetical protein
VPLSPLHPNRRADFVSNPWRRLLAAVFVLLLTECHRSPERAGAAEAGVPLPRYWLQRVSLSDVPNGPSTHTVKGPVLVELGPNGHVNSLPGSPEVVAGFVPVTLLTRPTDRAGLMLYAQRTTELHLDSNNGPVIGRLHPGAFVGVAASGVEHVEVAVPRYTRINASPPPNTLFAYVDATALGPEPTVEVTPELPGRLVRNFPFPLHLREQWAAINGLLCGELHIVEVDGDTRATQYYRGIEVSGWFESRWHWGDHGPVPCQARMVFRDAKRLVLLDGRDWLDAREIPAVPQGYLPVAPPSEDPLTDVILHGKPMYFLTRAHEKLACRKWRASAKWLRAGHSGKNCLADRDMLEGELLQHDDRLGTYFLMNYTPVGADKSGGSIELLGPYFKQSGTGYKGGVAFQLLLVHGDIIYMERPRTLPSMGYTPVAFLPEDVEHWYLSHESCEVAKAHAVTEIERDPNATERLGLHFEFLDKPYE